MVQLRNINKIFNKGTINESTLFDDFSLSVNKGEFVSIVGSNGSGKTTLLNIISGSIGINDGNVMLGGKDITMQSEHVRARKIGRVYQNPSVGTVPNMTILENICLADNKGKPYLLSRAINKNKTKSYTGLVSKLGLGLEDKMNMPVGLLSGGQRQALSLIMSTMTPIDLLLLDEHTAALDPRTAETIMGLTNSIVKEKALTAIMVTHNLRYAVEYGNRLIMMNEGKAVLDKTGNEKVDTSVNDLLHIFNNISIECGN